jgi:NADPH:quinone reductase
MKAIVIKEFGGVDQLVIETVQDPEPKVGHAVIQVKAFGINHAENHMRKGEWAAACAWRDGLEGSHRSTDSIHCFPA